MLNALVDWQFTLQALSLAAVVVTVLFGSLALIASVESNRRQTDKNLKLEASNIEAQRQLEAERKTRVEMEADIAPRMIPLIEHGGTTNIDPLKPFAGTGVVIEYAPDSEAQTAAQNIQSLTQAAGWKVVKAYCPPDLIDFNEGIDGVVVEPYRRPKDKLSPELNPDEQRSKQTAETLVAFLKSYNWTARVGLGFRGELSPGTVKVQVGFKPTPYFLKPAMDAVKKQYEKNSRHPYKQR